MVIRNKLVAGWLLLMSTTSVHSIGVPVVDAANLANSIQNLVKWSEQLKGMKNQLNEQKKQFDSLNGLRDVGKLLNNELLNQYIPEDYQAAVDQLLKSKGGDFSGIAGSIKTIIANNQAKSCAALNSEDALIAACKKNWSQLALNKSVGNMGYKQASKNIRNLQSYIGKITTSTDPKTLQDLQARIAVEQVRMQNEQIKFDAIKMMQEADAKMRTQKIHDGFTAKLALGSSGGISF